MKVIRLTTLLDFGGQEQQYISFTEEAELLTNEYMFVAIGHGGFASNVIKERGFDVRTLGLNYSIRNISIIWKLYKLFKLKKPDIVHTAAAEANFHGLIAAKLAGVKTILGEEIGIPNHSKMARILFKLVYKLSDGVICVSQSVKEHLIKIKEITEHQGIVIYNPVSIPQTYKKLTKDVFEIVFVGRLQKVKNLAVLLRAIEINKNENIRLTIVGDGIEMSNLKLLCNDLNINSKVSFVGFQKKPAQFVSQADLFILPSISEGFGIAAVEAMYQGVPCLCSRVGGIPEFIEENKTGWLFDPSDHEELAAKIKLILYLPEKKLQEVTSSAKIKAFNSFTVAMYCENIENLYARKN